MPTIDHIPSQLELCKGKEKPPLQTPPQTMNGVRWGWGNIGHSPGREAELMNPGVQEESGRNLI